MARLNLSSATYRSQRGREVRVRVEVCGVCHSDSFTVEGQWPNLSFPRIPGHEIAGVIDAVGPDVVGWDTGQRVGVGV